MNIGQVLKVIKVARELTKGPQVDLRIEFQPRPEVIADALASMPNTLQDKLKAAMASALMLLQDKIATYPPPPPTSTYIRTGQLGRSWSRQVREGGGGWGSGGGPASVWGKVGNATSYGPWVQDRDRQAWCHARTGWGTIQGVIEQNAAEVKEILARAGSEAVEITAAKAK